MINNFIFTVGLPGCGKSTYLEQHYKNAILYLGDETNIHEKDMLIVSADEIKQILAGYSATHPETVHEESVQQAKQLVFDLANNELNVDVIMDGGGLNNHYTKDIIKYVKKHCSDAKVTCLFFDTPIDVCIERVNSRERKIPLDAFYSKNLKIAKCIEYYQQVADEYIRIDYYTNKYIFLDMDGTIVSYRKGKLDEDGNTDFVNSHLFLNASPVPHLINFVKENFNMENVYIITAVANNIVLDEKIEWLKKYFPEIKKENFLWVGNKNYKHVFLKHFALLKKMKHHEMTVIDDMHETLTKCLSIGMNAIHPSNIYALTDKNSTLG